MPSEEKRPHETCFWKNSAAFKALSCNRNNEIHTGISTRIARDLLKQEGGDADIVILAIILGLILLRSRGNAEKANIFHPAVDYEF